MRRLALLFALAVSACTPDPVPAPDGGCKTVGGAACDISGTQLLQCDGNAWVIFSDCKGAAACMQEGETVNCDTSGNGAGDRCPPTSEGKVRCQPDAGAEILRCVDGGLTIIFTCPVGSICGLVPDAGLTCI